MQRLVVSEPKPLRPINIASSRMPPAGDFRGLIGKPQGQGAREALKDSPPDRVFTLRTVSHYSDRSSVPVRSDSSVCPLFFLRIRSHWPFVIFIRRGIGPAENPVEVSHLNESFQRDFSPSAAFLLRYPPEASSETIVSISLLFSDHPIFSAAAPVSLQPGADGGLFLSRLAFYSR